MTQLTASVAFDASEDVLNQSPATKNRSVHAISPEFLMVLYSSGVVETWQEHLNEECDFSYVFKNLKTQIQVERLVKIMAWSIALLWLHFCCYP